MRTDMGQFGRSFDEKLNWFSKNLKPIVIQVQSVHLLLFTTTVYFLLLLLFTGLCVVEFPSVELVPFI